MRKTKHIRRRDMDRVISSVAERRKAPGKMKTGGAIYAHHYTGKVHYVAQGVKKVGLAQYHGPGSTGVDHRYDNPDTIRNFVESKY